MYEPFTPQNREDPWDLAGSWTNSLQRMHWEALSQVRQFLGQSVNGKT